MTKQEVKDESKMLEGNPEIKGRVRKVQREMARRRMLAAVPEATVVITNPTHIAVALEYQRERMVAPKVVAMGGDLMAERIKAVAREHGVPIVENVALARALFANAEVGDVDSRRPVRSGRRSARVPDQVEAVRAVTPVG